MRRYEAAWNQLKNAPVNSKTGMRKITIKGKPAKMDTIVQGILKEKARENVVKKELGLDYYGELIIIRRHFAGETEICLPAEMKKRWVNLKNLNAEAL